MNSYAFKLWHHMVHIQQLNAVCTFFGEPVKSAEEYEWNRSKLEDKSIRPRGFTQPSFQGNPNVWYTNPRANSVLALVIRA